MGLFPHAHHLLKLWKRKRQRNYPGKTGASEKRELMYSPSVYGLTRKVCICAWITDSHCMNFVHV